MPFSAREFNPGASVESIGTLDGDTKLVTISLDDPEDAQEVADSLIAEDEVVLVQPNYKYRLAVTEEPQTAGDDAVSDDPDDDESASVDKTRQSEEKNDPSIDIDDEEKDSDKLVSDSEQTGSAVTADDTESNDLTGKQWHLGNEFTGSIRAESAWGRLSGSNNTVKVAVIDTGLDYEHSFTDANGEHKDFSDVVITSECVSFENGTNNHQSFTNDGFRDDTGHGTHVCGIIAARANDGAGTTGVAYNRAKLIVIDAQRYDANEKADCFATSDVAYAINYAVSKGAKVINLSLGGKGSDYVMSSAIKNAWENGVLCVCAAGNENTDAEVTPGDTPYAISVMSHNKDGKKSSFSNYGVEKDVSAPGYNILSTLSTEIQYYNNSEHRYKDYLYGDLSGTSMAAPMVTGLAALLLSENKNLKPRELKNYIYTSSGNGTYGSQGFGRIDFNNAVDNLKTSALPQSIVINKSSVTVKKGRTASVEYAVYPGSASKCADETTFTSSNASVASVDSDGIVTGHSGGSAIITASCGGAETTFSVFVSSFDVGSASISGMSNKAYNGRAQTQDPVVKLDGYTLVKDRDYTLSYSNNVNIGTATMTVKGKGKYSGSKKVNFTIYDPYLDNNIRKATIKKPGRAKKAVTAKWKKQTGKTYGSRVTGYQVQIATNPGFTNNVRWATVKGYKKTKNDKGGYRKMRPVIFWQLWRKHYFRKKRHICRITSSET